MTRICLIHPPHPKSTDDCLDPPLGLASIAAFLHLRAPWVEVEILDLAGKKTPTDWAIPFADMYGITVYAPTFEVFTRIAAKCLEVNPKAKIVVGGAHVSAVPMDFKAYADHAVVGRGEHALVDILRGGAPFIVSNSRTDGLFLRPAFRLLDLTKYRRRIGGRPSLPVLTSRGCPYKCLFCGLTLSHQDKILKKSAEDVIADIEYYIGRYGIRAFGFQDDIFTMWPNRLDDILKGLRQLDIKFRCHGRAGMDTEETYAKLAEAGCVQVAWGVESGSQAMLDRMQKHVTVEQNRQVIHWAKKYGIDSRAFFVLGFPGETAETLEETRRFIVEADPDQYFCSSFVPYPGTAVWDAPARYGVTTIDRDFTQYYQVDENGYGGLTIDTEWLSRQEFRALEIGFRTWLKQYKPMRGNLLDYEAKK